MPEKRRDHKGRILNKGESQRKDGRYQYRYTDIYGRRKCIYDMNLNNLRKREKGIRQDIIDRFDSEKGEITLNEQFQRYMAIKTQLAPTTRTQYMYVWEKYVEGSELGRKKICYIKKSDVLLFYTKCSKEGLSNGTIRIFGKLICPALELAVDDDYIRKNPARGCLREFGGGGSKKEALTLDQQIKFMEFVKDTRSGYYDLFCFLLGTGCRISEAAGITWNDIDMKNRTVNINHQLLYLKEGGKKKPIIAPTKTDAGNRIIHMTNEVYACLQKRRKDYFLYKSDHEVDGYKDFVFSSSRGRLVYATIVDYTLNRLVDAYNDVHEEKMPHISAHTFRHTACTRMAEAGMDVRVLQYVMGHSKINMTMEVYNHINQNRVKREMEKMNVVV